MSRYTPVEPAEPWSPLGAAGDPHRTAATQGRYASPSPADAGGQSYNPYNNTSPGFFEHIPQPQHSSYPPLRHQKHSSGVNDDYEAPLLVQARHHAARRGPPPLYSANYADGSFSTASGHDGDARFAHTSLHGGAAEPSGGAVTKPEPWYKHWCFNISVFIFASAQVGVAFVFTYSTPQSIVDDRWKFLAIIGCSIVVALVMIGGSPIILLDKGIKTRKGIKIAVHVVSVVLSLALLGLATAIIMLDRGCGPTSLEACDIAANTVDDIPAFIPLSSKNLYIYGGILLVSSFILLIMNITPACPGGGGGGGGCGGPCFCACDGFGGLSVGKQTVERRRERRQWVDDEERGQSSEEESDGTSDGAGDRFVLERYGHRKGQTR